MCLLANSVNPKSAKDEQKTTTLSTALAKSIIIFSIECVFHNKVSTLSKCYYFDFNTENNR
ncbi:hypothetical protein CWB75_10565 [Pseudoalteromonas sp. S1608]|nr:hypothetical protein CWB75_10565 [Pseudoalteromonas sp. S1608]